MKKADEHVVSILADNKVGVLTRIITGVRREGCNIKSLTAARTTDSNYARITMNIECYDYLLSDVIDRINSLNCVRSLSKYDKDSFIEREYVVFSVVHGCKASEALINKYNAINIQDNIYELTGNRDTVNECILELNEQADVDIARTGSIILKINDGGCNE